jgi:hypothetical protein
MHFQKFLALGTCLLVTMPAFAAPKVPGEREKTLFQCIQEKAAAGNYTYLDGGLSADHLLKKECSFQYAAYVNACARGAPRDRCVVKGEGISKRALRALNK